MPHSGKMPRSADREPQDIKTPASETARYIAALALSLGEMARRDGLDLVAYFLDLARLEAEQTVSPPKSVMK